MKIGIFSDLHLEFRATRDISKLIDVIQNTECDVMINAGDTHPSPQSRKVFHSLITKHHPKYIDVMGNHDYYGNKWVDNNFRCQVIDNVKIVSATLWTNFALSPIVEEYSRRNIYDFRQIEGVSSELMIENFDRTVDYIDMMRPDVVVTHFAPHPLSTHPRFAGHFLNPYFVNNLDSFICNTKPKLWVHGHVHDAFDYQIHQTHVVANPLGYPGETYASAADYKVKIVEL
jgi:Icc-related predicted phosphoesterase